MKPDGRYVDATFGRGGHSREILARLGPAGAAAGAGPRSGGGGGGRRDLRYALCHCPCAFSELGATLDARGMAQVDGVLLDLGVSSPQLDDAEPGHEFSFRCAAGHAHGYDQGGDRGGFSGAGR